MVRSSATKEAAFGDVAFRWRRCESRGGWFLGRRCLQRSELRQALDRIPKLPGQVAVAENAETLAAVERVLAGPGAQNHFGMVEEVAIDRNLCAIDHKRSDTQPVGIDVAGRFAPVHASEETRCRSPRRFLLV